MTMGLLVVRIAVGVALLAQASGKLRPKGRAEVATYFRGIGFEPAGVLALLTGLVELGAGLLLVGGLATPLAAAAATGVLVNASAVNSSNGWASANGGAEYPVTLGLVTAGLIFTGPGGASLDAAAGWHGVHGVSTGLAIAALCLAVVAAAPFLAIRHRRLGRGVSAAAAGGLQ